MKFKSDIEVQAGLKDSSGAIGTSGQVLSSTGSNVSWVNQTTVANDVQNRVKAGVAINKGQAVYVTGADGTNIIVGLASNATEATSSKTLGLLNATVAINGMADVVQIGRLSGLNTLGAVAGDPVWLGTGGNLIYGLINKPYAPANLVFIGVVTRVNVSNGEIFVSVQNGFELKEIHDVDLITNVPINGDVLGYDGTLWVNKTIAQWLGFTPANASGTTNYVSKFTGTTTLGNSLIYDDGSNVGIGTTSPLTGGGAAKWLTLEGSTYGGGIISSVSNVAKGYLYYDNGSNSFALQAGSGVGATIWTNSVERLRITSAGNVGIGTSSPANLFTVRGNGNNMASLQYNNDAGGLGLGFLNSSGTELFSIGGGRFQRQDELSISRQGTSVIYINNSNNVGIGTTTPISIGSYTTLDLRGTNGSLLYMGQAGATASLRLIGEGTDGYIDNINISGSLLFRTNAATERMRITLGGFVGIGTSTPSQKLDVNGSIKASQSLTIGTGGNYEAGSIYSDSGWGMIFRAKQSIPTQAQFMWADSLDNELMRIKNGNLGIGTTSPAAKLDVSVAQEVNGYSLSGYPFLKYSSGDVLDYGAFGSTWQALRFLTNGSERMRITSGGNVGIGTTSPYSLLNISGSTPIFTIENSANSLAGIEFTSSVGVVDAFIKQRRDSGEFRLSSGRNSSWGGFQTFYTDTVERMRITPTGNVGIGTSMPSAKLDVVDTMTNPTLRLAYVPSSGYGGGGNIDFVGGYFDYVSGAISWKNGTTVQGQVDYTGVNRMMTLTSQSTITFRTTLMERMRIDSTGQVGIGTSSPMYTLHVNGSVAGTSAYINLSDERYKKDILPIENALDKVLSLNGVTFNWDKGFNPRVNLDNNNHIGLIAQEVEKIIPQAVSTASDGEKTKSVAYSDLVPVLIEAIKEQQKQIEELKKLINK